MIHGFKKELQELLNKYGATLRVDLEGDTHCLGTTFVVDFNSGETATLKEYDNYLNASDLED